MLDKVKQLIIIGGGTSIKEGISKDLWKEIENKFTFGLNYSFNYFPNPTTQLFVDDEFYTDEKEKMKYLPLIIGKEHSKIAFLPNTIMLKCKSKYTRDLSDGVYKSTLIGLFALSLGIYLLDEGTIFLLGYDFGGQKEKDKRGRSLTHFYQGDINHRGIGKISYFTQERANRDFGVYKNEKKVKIYNVSLQSKINTFEKISYSQFFKILNNKRYNQNELQEQIQKKLKARAK